MVKRVLFCATVDYHFKAFHLPYLKWFKEQGWEVHLAACGELEIPYVDHKFNLPLQRSPFNRKNISAYKGLKRLINKFHYQIVHCHTPMGGVLARLAARKHRANGTKVIYTAHGFHFCKGAPKKNWLIYYPIEKYLSRYTDCLVTINKEDYDFARKRLNAQTIKHVHGVGVDQAKFKPISENEKVSIRKSLGYLSDDFLLFYAAEFNHNKNQQSLIYLLKSIKPSLPNTRLLLAGEGHLLKECKVLAEKLGVDHMVDFLGFKKGIEKILPICDLAISSSRREGLPVNIMEAMACGLPVIVSDIRGHRDLVSHGKNGWIIDKDIDMLQDLLPLLQSNPDLRTKAGMEGVQLIKSCFSVERVLDEQQQIYLTMMEEEEQWEWACQ
ncbi:glycosyltransferase family 4 protein [Falsibacillus albus]|uniref:Glycosyltransferase family 1 protein n=1 Tax=Falsibacillus albus TaxID=2478915 RepID=A0A3L7JZR8_9BACI|nr:glycosyltransferase family 4 protein [Falsibacillus albus]RLQ96283.1 glycosyltransferase family 1 protein [Falsibacillus albus]